MADAAILFQDEHLVVAVKPYGVLSEDGEKQPGMPAILKEQIGSEIYPVHRLDKTTQGIMAFAKTRASAAGLSEMIQRGEIEKTYLAVVEGVPDEAGEMTDLLFFDRRKNKSYVVRRDRKGVKEARLRYERLATAELGGTPVARVRIRLDTGRTHQIRVQFASRKMPLVGDRRYGSRITAENIALCAAGLSFSHPITRERMHFEIVPDDGIFDQVN